MRKDHKTTLNLLTLCPLAVRKSETKDSGLDDILIPRFGNHGLGRWLMRQTRRPYHRIHLDEVGTFVWRQLDGRTSVRSIGDAMGRKFGDQVEPVMDRLSAFIHQLCRARVIQMREGKERS